MSAAAPNRLCHAWPYEAEYDAGVPAGVAQQLLKPQDTNKCKEHFMDNEGGMDGLS